MQVIQDNFIHNQLEDEENINDKTRKELQKICGNINYCIENLGFLCAYEVCYVIQLVYNLIKYIYY